MDLASLSFDALSFATERTNLRSLPLFHSPGNHWRLFFHGRDVYLRISDLLPDENEGMREIKLLQMPEDAERIAEIRREPPEPRGPRRVVRTVLGLPRPQAQVTTDNFLAQLPDPREKSVRICIEQGLGPQVFQNYFSADVTDATRRMYAHPTTRGYNGLSFQWRTPVPDKWFEAPSFILSGQNPPGLVINVKKVSTVEHSGEKLICKQVVINVLLMRTSHSLTENLVLISSETWESSGFAGMRPIKDNNQQASARVLESLKTFARDFEQLQDNYRPLLRKAYSCQRRKQVLLLWFHHAHLSHTIRSFEEVRWIYQEVREPEVDSGRFESMPHLLDKVIIDANFFKGLEDMAEDLTTTLEVLLDVVGVGFENNGGRDPEFNTVAADLRGLSSDLRRKAGDLPKTLAHHIHFLEMRRSINASYRTEILTILASIFLPLSLACGVLSMQTRLKDLNYLLYGLLRSGHPPSDASRFASVVCQGVDDYCAENFGLAPIQEDICHRCFRCHRFEHLGRHTGLIYCWNGSGRSPWWPDSRVWHGRRHRYCIPHPRCNTSVG